MKKAIVIVAFCVVLAVALIATCPDEIVHRDAIVNEITSELVVEDGSDSEFTYAVNELYSTVIEMTVNNRLSVSNCLLFSLGRMDGAIVSLGLLNHVFVFDLKG